MEATIFPAVTCCWVAPGSPGRCPAPVGDAAGLGRGLGPAFPTGSQAGPPLQKPQGPVQRAPAVAEAIAERTRLRSLGCSPSEGPQPRPVRVSRLCWATGSMVRSSRAGSAEVCRGRAGPPFRPEGGWGPRGTAGAQGTADSWQGGL